MTTPRPFALRLFVPSGLPEGMRIVEKTNWSGIGYVIPRSQLKEFTQRPEAGRPGVYVLTGPDPEDGGADLAYIGEAAPSAGGWSSTRPRSSGPPPTPSPPRTST